MDLTANFALAPSLGGGKDTVRYPAPVIFRAGKYPFPAASGGDYEMSPEEIREAVKAFTPVPLTIEHKRSVFDGKLGSVVKVTPAADHSAFGGEVEIPRWLDQVLGKGERKLSASWDRTTKRLKHVALVVDPRITDATFARAYADFAEGDYGAAAPAAAGAGGKLTVTGDADALAKLQGICEAMGLSCQMDGAGNADGTLPAVPEMTAPMSASPAFRALQEQVKQLQEANFAAERSKAEAEAKEFALSLTRGRSPKIVPAQVMGVFEEYRQAWMDDRAHPAQVNFSKDNQPARGTRVDALKARWAQAPGTGLNVEHVADRAGEEALFSGQGGGAQPPSPERKKALLNLTPLGRKVLAEQAKNGR